jgi:hypothetical protein
MQAWFPSARRTGRVLISLGNGVAGDDLFVCRPSCSSVRIASDAADRRVELDVHMGLLAEHEITYVLQMLDAIQEQLGIAHDADSELADLEMETRPEDVLAEIDRVHRQVKG